MGKEEEVVAEEDENEGEKESYEDEETCAESRGPEPVFPARCDSLQSATLREG